MADIISNYVKFRRGTPTAFAKLENKDPDTLYFIYEESDLDGELYLGSKLIAGSGEINGATTLADLTDTLITTGLNVDSFLIYDIVQGKWIDKPISSVLHAFVGTTGKSNGVQGLVPAPSVDEVNYFLRSDGHWAEIVTASETKVLQSVVGTEEEHPSAITRILRDNEMSPQRGDIIVLKDLIAEGKYQHTSYTFDGKNWVAMDGNYNAENVYLANDLTITADIGVQTLDGAGSKVLNTAGKNLKQVLDMILAARTLPTYKLPSVSLTSAQIGEYEVGTNVTVSYSATFNDGSYSFEPKEETGVTVTSWKASFNGETVEEQSGSFQTIALPDNFNQRVGIAVTYGAGVAPYDNLGELVTKEDELSTCQIPAGSKTGYAGYVKSYRKMFYGSFVNKIELTNENIRALDSLKAEATTFDMPVVDGATYIVIAVPAGKTIPTVADFNAFGTNIAEKFEETAVSVAGASEGFDTDYTVYTFAPSAALSANTYTVSVV